MNANGSACFNLPLSRRRHPENILNLCVACLHDQLPEEISPAWQRGNVYGRGEILRKWSKIQF